MSKKTAVIPLVALAAAFFLAAQAAADTLGKVTTSQGGPPATVMAENPQDSLRMWSGKGLKGRTLVIISEDIPLGRLDEDACSSVLKEIAGGRWEGLSAGEYETYVEYPVNRADYVYLAAKAGIISKVYWVPPTRDSIGKESMARVQGNMYSLGAAPEELGKFVQDDTSIKGTVNGVPLYICNLRDLPHIDEDVILAVDLSFFDSLYKDEVYTPFLELLTAFMHTLGTSGLKVSDAVISYSTALGQVPLEHRFVGYYLRSFLEHPELLADGPPLAWQLRAEGMYYETFFQSEKELEAYKKAVDAAPNDASLRYSLAMAYFTDKNIDRMKEELDRAVALDRGFYHAYITYGTYLAGKGLPQAGEDFVDEAAKISPDDPAVLEATNNVKTAAGKFAEALAAQKKLVAMGYEGPKPYYNLAQDYAGLNDYANAITAYEKALGMLPVLDSELRPQVLLGLAQAYEASGKVEKALDTYEQAINATLDSHARDRIIERYRSLKQKWAPFMGGGKPAR